MSSIFNSSANASDIAITSGALAGDTVGVALQRIATQGNGVATGADLVSAAVQLMVGDGGGGFFSMTRAELLNAIASTYIQGLLDDADATAALTTLGAAPLASPALTGNPTAPTQSAGNNSTRIATTAYADAAATAVASGWTTVTKTADETITSDSTLSDDATLKFSVSANTKYRFRFNVFFKTGATADFKYALTGPASPTILAVRMSVCAAFGSVVNYRSMGQYSDTAQSLLGSPASAVNEGGFVILEGVLHNGANAGTVAFQWAQDTSDAGSTSVLAGSTLEWKQV